MRNKYGAKKTIVDGITFDSRAEATYYKKLKQRRESGEIVDFELQPKFLLQPGFEKNGKKFRAINYIADFMIYNLDGTTTIVDVKGVETETFRIKRKMFEEKFPKLSLQIVKGDVANAERTKRPKTAEEKEKAKQRAERKKKSRERRNLRARL